MAKQEKNFLEIVDLKKGFGSGDTRQEVLCGMNFSVAKGEFCVLLGPSGSGKSTLLNIIGGIDGADSGYISINGDRLEDMNEKRLTAYRRKHLGYVFQMYNLIGNLNVRENIETGAYLSDNPLEIDELLHTLGLYEHRYKLPNQLSGGQQQRTSIGRAIVKNPDLLLCDEPTGALDYNTSREILKLIEDINQKYGNTVIMVTKFDIKADVLVSLALIASVMIGEDFAAGEVAFIMQLGGLLEDLTVAKARAGIERLVHLTPGTARKIENGTENVIPAAQVQAGDILRVFPGETVPVDGIILSGNTSINQAVMTGEPLPVDKGVGDDVLSGTVNQFGSFDMKAVKVGEDSSIQRMIRLVQSADAGKAKIVGIADRWATWIVVIALSAAALTWLLSGQIIRAVTILVVFCPCALVLATPTAIMAAIGNASKHGFLVREGDALERLALVSNITFDKTGTLTYGTPAVVFVHSFQPNVSDASLYRFAASAEIRSEHPLGKAIAACYRSQEGEELFQAEDFYMLPGRGVQAVVEGKEILAGNRELMEERNLPITPGMTDAVAPHLEKGCTIIYISLGQNIAGYIALSDTLRENAKEVIGQIKNAGVTPILLTGDHKSAAAFAADRIGIEELLSDCLPEDKLNYIDACQQQGKQVCMIGDGINDAPALKKSYVGIAMGGIGSDIAVDAADIALINDDIKEIPHLLRLSKRMMLTIKCNLTFSMTLNFVAIVLAITGILNPVVGALVHNAGSVLVIVNSALLLGWKERERR